MRFFLTVTPDKLLVQSEHDITNAEEENDDDELETEVENTLSRSVQQL